MAFFSLQPFLLSQVEWRNNMLEETEALLHSSVQLNRALKVLMCLILIFLLTAVEFGVVNAVIDKLFAEAKYWVAMLCDSASLTLPLVCLGIYSRLPFQTVQLVGSIPFLGMLFFSTTFSPGAGVPVLKELRYLYPRFYFFCMVPGVQQEMEGCPSDDVIVPYMILSTFTGIFLLFTVIAFVKLRHHMKEKKRTKTQECIKVEDETYREIQMKLYGRWLGKDTLSSSNLISVEDMV